MELRELFKSYSIGQKITIYNNLDDNHFLYNGIIQFVPFKYLDCVVKKSKLGNVLEVTIDFEEK